MLTGDNITDDEIRDLMRDAADHAISVICRTALSRLIPERFDTRQKARERCAEIINTRRAGLT